MTSSLLVRNSAISAAWAICVVSIAFILSTCEMSAALCAGSGTGQSLMARRADSVAGKEEAEARTMERRAS